MYGATIVIAMHEIVIGSLPVKFGLLLFQFLDGRNFRGKQEIALLQRVENGFMPNASRTQVIDPRPRSKTTNANMPTRRDRQSCPTGARPPAVPRYRNRT